MILIKQKNGKSILIAVTKTHDNKKCSMYYLGFHLLGFFLRLDWGVPGVDFLILLVFVFDNLVLADFFESVVLLLLLLLLLLTGSNRSLSIADSINCTNLRCISNIRFFDVESDPRNITMFCAIGLK